jgi:hypothetical protein
MSSPAASPRPRAVGSRGATGRARRPRSRVGSRSSGAHREARGRRSRRPGVPSHRRAHRAGSCASIGRGARGVWGRSSRRRAVPDATETSPRPGGRRRRAGRSIPSACERRSSASAAVGDPRPAAPRAGFARRRRARHRARRPSADGRRVGLRPRRRTGGNRTPRAATTARRWGCGRGPSGWRSCSRSSGGSARRCRRLPGSGTCSSANSRRAVRSLPRRRRRRRTRRDPSCRTPPRTRARASIRALRPRGSTRAPPASRGCRSRPERRTPGTDDACRLRPPSRRGRARSTCPRGTSSRPATGRRDPVRSRTSLRDRGLRSPGSGARR